MKDQIFKAELPLVTNVFRKIYLLRTEVVAQQQKARLVLKEEAGSNPTRCRAFSFSFLYTAVL